jgi:hypothetical protein
MRYTDDDANDANDAANVNFIIFFIPIGTSRLTGRSLLVRQRGLYRGSLGMA